MSDLPVDNEQESAPFRNPATSDPKDIGVNHIGNNKNELNKIAIEDLSVEVTTLKLFVKEQFYIAKKQLEELVSYNQPDKNASYISSVREEIE